MAVGGSLLRYSSAYSRYTVLVSEPFMLKIRLIKKGIKTVFHRLPRRQRQAPVTDITTHFLLARWCASAGPACLPDLPPWHMRQ